MSKTGDLIKTHRERLGMSQQDLSDGASLSRGVISETESGELPKLSTIVQLRDGLKLDRNEWRKLLAVYLVEGGAIDEIAADAEPVTNQASSSPRIGNTDRSGRKASLLRAIHEDLERMTDDELRAFAAFSQTLERHPVLYDAMRAFNQLAAPATRRSGGRAAATELV